MGSDRADILGTKYRKNDDCAIAHVSLKQNRTQKIN